MKVLVAFGTTEGQARKIAGRIVEKGCALGHEAETFDCSRRLSGLNIKSFDAIVVAASVHQKFHQKHVVAFVAAHLQQLQTKPSAFVSVSLSAALANRKAEARSYLDSFLRDTGWRPMKTHLAAGALRYTEYDFFKEHIIRYVVMAGRDLPDGREDCEWTDWEAIDEFTATFLEVASSPVR